MQQIVELEINSALTAILGSYAARHGTHAEPRGLPAEADGILAEPGHWVARRQWLEMLRSHEHLLERPQTIDALADEWLRHPAGDLLERICLPYDRPELAFADLPAIMASFYRAGRFQTSRLEPGKAHVAFLPFDREGDMLEMVALAGLFTGIARLAGSPRANGRYAGVAGHQRMVEVAWEPAPVPRRVLWTGGGIGGLAGTVLAVVVGAGPLWGGLMAGASMATGVLAGRQFGLQGVWRHRLGRILAEKDRMLAELERQEQEIRLAQSRLVGLLELTTPISSLTDPEMLGQEIADTAMHWLGADGVAFWQRQGSEMKVTGLAGMEEPPFAFPAVHTERGLGCCSPLQQGAEEVCGSSPYGADLMLPIGDDPMLGMLVAFYHAESLPPLGKVIGQRLGRDIRLLLEMQEEGRRLRQEQERSERLASLGCALLQTGSEEEIQELLEGAGFDLLAPCQVAWIATADREAGGESDVGEGATLRRIFPLGDGDSLGELEVAGPLTERQEEWALSMARMAQAAIGRIRQLQAGNDAYRRLSVLEDLQRLLAGGLSSSDIRQVAEDWLARHWTGACLNYREGTPMELAVATRLRDGHAVAQSRSGETVPLPEREILLPESGLARVVFPVRSEGVLFGTLTVEPGGEGWPAEVSVWEMGWVLGQVVRTLAGTLRLERLEEMADRDPLTGLYNEREFRARLEGELSRTARHGGTGSLLLVEVDQGRSEQFLERFLHLVGDTMGRIGRRGDVAGRIGDRRFAFLLPCTVPQKARFVAQRLIEEISRQTRQAVPLRIGLAAFPDDSTHGEGLLKLAAQALQLAAEPGREPVQGIDELLERYSSPERFQQLVKEFSRESLDVLILMAAAREPVDRDHGRRVSELSVRVAEAFGLHGGTLDRIRTAAVLHDIGKLAIPAEILGKAGPMSEAERACLQGHAAEGADLLAAFPFLEEEREIIRCHHEHYDGSGYPDRLRGRDIPLGARILVVVDAYDAMVHGISGGHRTGPREAQEELQRHRGTWYDPVVVDRFLEVLRSDSTRHLTESGGSA